MSPKSSRSKRPPLKWVTVSNKSYGKALKGLKVYYEGVRPAALKKDGSITFGKHILETLGSRFTKFQWIITQGENSIRVTYGVTRVRTSQSLLRRMTGENYDRSRDIKNEIVTRFFGLTYPEFFSSPTKQVYVPGSLGRLIHPDIITKLSTSDKEALTSFLPEFIAAEAAGKVSELKAVAEIRTLKGLAADLKAQLKQKHTESWWQDYIKANILLMQQGYIKPLPKLNVAIGDMKFPDFCLVSHDSYLDILEIKRPDTPILKLDASRGNYYLDPEVAKAVIQTENYIEHVTTQATALRSYLLDKEHLLIKVVRPRGIVLAGDATRFTAQKERDDFRLLSQGLKHVQLVTYDELLARLENYITVLESFKTPQPSNRKPRRSKQSPQRTS